MWLHQNEMWKYIDIAEEDDILIDDSKSFEP
jgi:hypothetical protein